MRVIGFSHDDREGAHLIFGDGTEILSDQIPRTKDEFLFTIVPFDYGGDYIALT